MSDDHAQRIDALFRPALTPVSEVRELEVVLQHLVDGAQALLPDSRGAAVVATVADDELFRVATDDALTALVDAELRLGDGPALAAMASREEVAVDADELARRWPELAALAGGDAGNAWLAVPLCLERRCLGVFVHVSTAPAVDDEARAMVRTLAGAALLSVERAAHEHHTRLALESHSLIGRALGILMERFDLTADAAFAYLQRLSSSEERKMRDVAADLVAERGRHRTGVDDA